MGVKFAEAFYQIRKISKILTKIVSGHQPAYLPWLGFHKMFVSDKFI